MKRVLIVLGVIIVVVTLVRGCGRGGSGIQLPEGEQTLRGTLHRVAVSLERRGTHMIYQGDKRLSLAESSLVDLGKHEGEEVTMKGMFEENTDPSYLPVFVVASVQEASADVRREQILPLRLSLEIPADWRLLTEESGARITAPGTSGAIVRVRTEQLRQLAGGRDMTVGKRFAVSVAAGSGQLVYVPQMATMIVFEFAPPEDDPEYERHANQFQALLRSVAFDATARSTASTGTGGTVCGGAAGFLCEEGYYCEVTDTTQNIGQCVPL